jgi:NAD(P)-dependent dehydrogenase (short-subunit alcohol dehydrogenase family)
MTTTNAPSLAGKVAVVTGGSSGIGAASVRLLAAAGAKVVVGYNKGADRAAAVIAELPGSGHRAMHLPLEDTAQIRKAASAVEEEFGRADILINSAGFTRMVPHHALEALDDELIDAVLTANVRGPFATIRAFVPLLRQSGDGVIVNISSGAAERHRQLDHLRGLESSTQHDEHGSGARARPRDPGRRRRPGHGPYRLRPRPHRGDDGCGRGGDAIKARDRSA